MGYFLIPHDDLQEISLGNSDFSSFTDGFNLKGDNGKYCAAYAIATPFDVIEAASLHMATSAQYSELYTFTQVCTLAKGKGANIYADSRHAFREADDFRILWKQHSFLTSNGNKIKNAPMSRSYWMQYFYLLCYLLLRFWGILNLTLWKLREITLLTFP